jgi:hypothetical protein
MAPRCLIALANQFGMPERYSTPSIQTRYLKPYSARKMIEAVRCAFQTIVITDSRPS